ncbi:hypothetical protein AB1Y20_001627 [Prymnesium parvum]|uniref:Aldehyde dehydrogenase domain-containing protein n=1 Tax=Prymnesium parvum TaxID=97485 RepID=A0AB34KC73_PRYPA
MAAAAPEWIATIRDAALSTPTQALWAAGGLLAFAMLLRLLWHPSVPSVSVSFEADAPGASAELSPGQLPCHDPSTGAFLGAVACESSASVEARVQRARAAQKQWAATTFGTRRQLLRIISKCVLEHAAEICRVSARDSGKTTTDAAFGEVLVTLEKLCWLCAEGESALKPERRSPGRMLFYKVARVEWHPRGVLGAIVPWNYPFHNILNPVSAAVFSGNAIIVKVSEHSLWSSKFYGRLLEKCLQAAGAPPDLVQVIAGDGTTGATLTRNVDMMTFVGSTRVGKLVMREAANTLTPVVLELGGKDPFVLLPGTKVDAVVDVAARAGWGASGQNCIGAERFFVHASLFEEFSSKICAIAGKMRQGVPLNAEGNTGVDIGAMCLPGEAKRIQSLVDDAVAHGATVGAGGKGSDSNGAQFFEPTVILVPKPSTSAGMRLLSEEVFGPLITVIKFENDDELIQMCNDCPFALGSSIFGHDEHVRRVGKHIQAGMLACNDFATCYMCQSLPMGGLKDSGFGKFAGVEGLRGCCVTKAVVEDRFSFMRTQLPPPLKYPLSDVAYPFVEGLMNFFYGASLRAKVGGIITLLQCVVLPSSISPKRKAA